jgi:hypothetical protein
VVSTLAQLRDRLVGAGLRPVTAHLSMGMSRTSVAIEEGATIVRVGTAAIRSSRVSACGFPFRHFPARKNRVDDAPPRLASRSR